MESLVATFCNRVERVSMVTKRVTSRQPNLGIVDRERAAWMVEDACLFVTYM